MSDPFARAARYTNALRALIAEDLGGTPDPTIRFFTDAQLRASAMLRTTLDSERVAREWHDLSAPLVSVARYTRTPDSTPPSAYPCNTMHLYVVATDSQPMLAVVKA